MFRYSLLAALLMLAACGTEKPECTNTNAILLQHQPWEQAYKTELARQMMSIGKDNIQIWINQYQEINGREYMYVDVVAKKLCAVAAIDITGEELLDHYRSVKGQSYRGAKLLGLEYRIIQTDTGYSFVFEDVGVIFD